MLAELARAGEALVAGGAGVALAALAARGLRARPRQGGHAPRRLHSTEALLDAAARSRRAQRHELQLRGQLRRGRRYERLLRGGRAFPARLLRALGALLAFSRVRWRTGHLALIFNALALYRFSFMTRRGRFDSAVALARRDGRKHFCHIDGLEALFRIRVTWFSRNISGSRTLIAHWRLAIISLRFCAKEESEEKMKNDE